MNKILDKIAALYKRWSGSSPLTVNILPGSGSYRTYYRIAGSRGTVLGAHNDDASENRAFVSFTGHFRSVGLPVPEVLAEDADNRIYLITDLGDVTLYQMLTQQRSTGKGSGEDHLPAKVIAVYRKTLDWLPVFQVKANQGLDYSACYPRAAFDRQSMMWDLNYFKYYFLKLSKIPFDEQALENNFSGLCDLLLGAESDFFLFRDFQSRNIMVVDGEPWFIDYQGGRKGALQYDVASLLTDAKADIPMSVRKILLEYYLDKLQEIYPVNRYEFLKSYYGFALIRILQALGAYGFRGYYENKTHFLQSIPFALRNLRYLRENAKIGFSLDALMEVIDRMVDTPALYTPALYAPVVRNSQKDASAIKLVVTVQSFSYKKQIPADESGNGGGFVFDCRALPNPGRFDEYKQLTGRDLPVIEFLKKERSVYDFLNHTFALVDQSVETYIHRGFEHLMVSFGCTGGQHRSVYCAEALAKHLTTSFSVTVKLIHNETFINQ